MDPTMDQVAQMNQSPLGGLIGLAVGLLFIVLLIVSLWKIFEKAGEPGWKCLIPIYNTYTLFIIAGKPGWWILLCLVPIANFIVLILAMIGVAKTFGKGSGFGLGLAFLGVIFFPILGFGSAIYTKPAPVTA